MIVLDTNVLVSAVFFGGVPGRILEAWRDGTIRVVLSAEILDEYRRVGRILASEYPGVDIDPLLSLLAVEAEVVEAPPLPAPVSSDPDDDKFLVADPQTSGGLLVACPAEHAARIHDGVVIGEVIAGTPGAITLA